MVAASWELSRNGKRARYSRIQPLGERVPSDIKRTHSRVQAIAVKHSVRRA